MEKLFDTKFKYEKQFREKVIYKFSAAQGAEGNVFKYHWQCFAWAAVVGFLTEKPRRLENIGDQSFSLKTMKDNGGERIAEALICMCIAKAGNVEILKTPEQAIEMINEYANAGFYKLAERLDERPLAGSDMEWVLQEIFEREIPE